jgi:hypothetical protein
VSSVRAKDREGRPTPAKVNTASVPTTTIKNASSIPHGLDPLADLDAIAEHLRGRFVIQIEVGPDRYRTHVYRNASAAERAVKRANDRGERAHVTLCQMLPVGVVIGLGLR